MQYGQSQGRNAGLTATWLAVPIRRPLRPPFIQVKHEQSHAAHLGMRPEPAAPNNSMGNKKDVPIRLQLNTSGS